MFYNRCIPSRGQPVNVVTTTRRYKDRTYAIHLLRRSFRRDGKVCKETVGNLSHLPDSLVDLIRRALRGETVLLATPPSELRDLGPAGLPGVRARRVTRAIYGVERTVVVTHNENLFAAQARTLERLSAKRERRLSELAGQLGRWCDGQVQGGRPPSVQGVTKKINGWLRARHMRDLFSVEIGERDGLPTLAHAFNEPAWQQLRTTLLGKTLLFTDNHDWSDADIVRGYRAQHQVEGVFRQMKRPQRSAICAAAAWTVRSTPCSSNSARSARSDCSIRRTAAVASPAWRGSSQA